MSNPIAVLTTINKPTESVKKIASLMPAIAIGDKKTPADWNSDNVKFVDVDDDIEFKINIPFNHYARKNIGYLLAIQYNATSIFDSDDDNTPNGNWTIRGESCKVLEIKEPGWCNVYSFFSTHKIWPRGLPLSEINNKKKYFLPNDSIVKSPIQQGLANGSPDVDAIWRLTDNSQVDFKFKRSIYLSQGVWCPFNSQSTWFFPEAYPLMYLPVYCSMRMTDIWRSFVAQRCLWEMGKGVTFHSPAEVYQEKIGRAHV